MPVIAGEAGMFERHTDRAKRAVRLAQEEAAGLGHDAVGTDHLLLGLLGEGGGVAFQALDSLGVTAQAASEAVTRRHPAGTGRAGGHLPWTPRFRKTMELALREALQLGFTYVATEHLLLGLIREGEDTGALVLADCGMATGDRGFLADVRAKVLELLRGYAETEKRKARGQEKAALDIGKILSENPRFGRKVRQFVALLDAAEVIGDLRPPNSEATVFYLRTVAEGVMRETKLGEEFLQAMIAVKPSVYEEHPDEPARLA